MRYLLILVLFAGCGAPMFPTVDTTDAKAKAALTVTVVNLDVAESTPTPTPTPKPVSDKCDNCDGTGRVSDHNGASAKCPECNGTGKKVKTVEVSEFTEPVTPTKVEAVELIVPKEPAFEPASEEKQKVIGTVFFYHFPGCSACVRWETEERSKFKDYGFNIVDMEYPEVGRMDFQGKIVELNGAPFFVINYNNKQFWFRGFLSLESFKNNQHESIK